MSARGYFPVVGIGALDGRQEKRKDFFSKDESFPNLGTPGVLPKPQTARSETGTSRGGPHHAPRIRPDKHMLCCQVGHRASECPKKGKPTSFAPGKRAFGTYALGGAMFDAMCYGAMVVETEEDQDAILDGGATKTLSGFQDSTKSTCES